MPLDTDSDTEETQLPPAPLLCPICGTVLGVEYDPEGYPRAMCRQGRGQPVRRRMSRVPCLWKGGPVYLGTDTEGRPAPAAWATEDGSAPLELHKPEEIWSPRGSMRYVTVGYELNHVRNTDGRPYGIWQLVELLRTDATPISTWPGVLGEPPFGPANEVIQGIYKAEDAGTRPVQLPGDSER